MTSSGTIHVTVGYKQIAILLFTCFLLMVGANSAFAATQTCAIINGGNAGPGNGVSPTYLGNQDGRANEGCNVLITFNADGSITTTNPNPATSYDNGHDDNMIGVVNNTGKAITSLQLSSVSEDIFGFDGDGVCSPGPGWTFSAAGPTPNCAGATDPNHYAAAGVTFTVTNSNNGTVNFGNGGIAPNGSAFFSLEGAVAKDLKVNPAGDPALVLTKSGPATMNMGQPGTFGLDIQNTGLSDAWNVSLRDLLPAGASGGMCNLTPTILSAQVFAPDGVTPVTGKGPLNQGSDYSLTYSAAPNCQLNLTMLSAAATVSPNQHLIIKYQTQLDANSQNGVNLTNVAGAIQWFNGNSGTTGRKTYTGPLTNGTPGVLDNQDAHTVTTAFSSDPVVVLTKSGPGTMNMGQWGAFALDVQNTGLSDAWNVSLRDLLPSGASGGMCNLTPAILSAQVFASDGVTPVAGKGRLNQGTDYSLTYSAAPNCQLNLTMLSAAATISPTQHLIIRYQAQLDGNSQDGVTLTNVAGAIQWFNAGSGTAGRKTYTGPLTNGTPGILDNQDAYTVTVSIPETDPALLLTKSGPATMNLGQLGNFGIDVQNTGGSDAWNVSVRDLLPNGASGGMCALAPTILSAQVFGPDGVTTVPGKGLLTQGTDYSVSFTAAPTCQLNLVMQSAAAAISSNQHLIIHYQTQLDANSQNGATLTNVAGAIQWFNGSSSVFGRKSYTGALTNGTPGVPDNQDAFTVTAAVSSGAYEFDKTVADLTSGANPATTAAPGDKLRYTLRFRTATQAMNNFRILDDMDALNAQAEFAPGTLTLVSSPAGADISATSSTGGTKGSGVIDVRNLSLPVNGTATIQFDITLKTPIANATVVTNQATLLLASGTTLAWSDDPNVNGIAADPTVPNGEDPTRVTIAAAAASDPALVLRKSGPATMILGLPGTFSLDIQNTGGNDAWNLSLRDLLPQGATGGMCAMTPAILSAQVFAADGVTPVAGKGPLNQGSDYSLNYSAAPNCQLNLTMLTSAGTVSPNQHLIIRYQTQLDANTQNAATLTNVAGATQWFNGDSSVAGRKTYTGPLTNGTPGILDNQDAFTVTATVSTGTYEFDKTVADLTSGANPATTAAAGDKLRYTLRFRTTNQAMNNFRILDDMDALNAQAEFAPGSLTLVTSPAGADISATNSTGGTKGTGVIDVRNLSLPANSTATIQFDITLKTPIANATVVTNQATLLLANGTTFAWSDDPNVNGIAADPTVPNGEDPTKVTIMSAPASDPALVVRKSGPTTMNLGQWGNFSIDVQNTGASDAWSVSLRDLLPNGSTGGMCSLTPGILSAQVFAADGVTTVAGKGPLNQGSDYSLSYSAAPNCQLDITMLSAAGTISQNQHLILRYRTQLDANTQNAAALTNVAGAIQWFNGDSSVAGRKTFSGSLTNGTPGVLDNQDAFTVTAALAGYEFDKTVANLTSGANPATTAAPGDKLRYTLRFRTTNQALNNFRIFDDMDALNAQAEFAPGSLTLVTSPAGADISATSSSGGSKGTGVIDVRNLSLPANGTATIQFDITLKTPIANATVVTNQATVVLANGTTFAWSDDPNVNGIAADPTVPNGEDPTRVTIASISDPTIVVTKSGPATMNLGQTGNFGIDVQNTGTSDAWNVSLRDLLPNGATGGMCTLTPAILSAQVFAADGVTTISGKGPLNQGSDFSLSYNAAPNCQLDITMLTAAGTIGPNQHLIVRYRTQLDANTQNGVTLTNIVGAIQWFNGDSSVTGRKTYTGPLTNGTPGVVDNQDAHAVTVALAGYFFDKTVADLTSGVNPATTAAPGDKLRYTLRFRTTTQALSNFRIFDDMDALNAQADFVPGSLTLVTSPAGADVSATSSSGGTKGTGVIDVRNLNLPVNGEALIQFDIMLKPAFANATVVTNQATLLLANGTTFAWSDDPNVNGSADPTVPNAEDPTRVTIAVGTGQQISITNQVSVVGGGPAIPGAQVDYVLTVTNIGTVPATNLVITDDLNASQAGQLTYVNQSATVNGLATGASFAGSTITANFGAVNGTLAPGAVVVVKFRATLNSNLALGTVVTNTGVASWNTPTQTTSASVSLVIGSTTGAPSFGLLSGSLWYDANFDGVQDSAEPVLAGWTVELYLGTQLLQSVVTDNTGAYRIGGVAANAQTGVRPQLQRAQTSSLYELRFRAPNAGANTALLGRAESPFTNGLQRISDIVVPAGATLQGLNLPIHPNGVVYNSIARTPVAGATLSLLDARSSSPLPAACFDDPAQQGQITLVDGYYKFDINFSDPACPSGGDYLIGISAPAGSNYVAGYSQIILPKSSASTAAFSVSTCPGSAADAIPNTALFCEAQPSDLAPVVSVLAGSPGTNYYIHLMLDNRQIPGSSEIFNNHIPLDPLVVGALTITKTTPLLNVTRGQLVPYTISANNHSGQALTDVTIVDRLPAGFTYIKGSALLDGVPTEPSIAGGTLSWNSLVITGTQTRTLKLLVAVGAGGSEGEYINRAQALNSVSGFALSGEATATVRLIPDPTFDCTDVIGKVFNDKNRNGRQDDGEEGLAGVRVVTPTGLQATTDKYGRYHITCAIVPNESRGSNVVLKLDDRTLPSGFRMSTDQLQIQRATSGKALTVNFAASIHRVVAIDLSDAAFEPGTSEMRDQWKPRLDILLGELRKAPSVLRLSYVADTEDEALVKQRVDAVKQRLTEGWNAGDHSYVLTIEPEVFWRRGAPPKRPNVRPQER